MTIHAATPPAHHAPKPTYGRLAPYRRRRCAARRRHLRLRHRDCSRRRSPTTPTPTPHRPSRSTSSSTTRPASRLVHRHLHRLRCCARPARLALRQRLVDRAPILTNTATVFAAIWAALMYATGMISNIGIEAVADLADTDPDRAASVWSAIDTVTNGLGGGNELVGGIWIGLISLAGFVTARLPRWLNVTGVVTASPDSSPSSPRSKPIEMVFGLGSIVWFIGAGIALLRRDDQAGASS